MKHTRQGSIESTIKVKDLWMINRRQKCIEYVDQSFEASPREEISFSHMKCTTQKMDHNRMNSFILSNHIPVDRQYFTGKQYFIRILYYISTLKLQIRTAIQPVFLFQTQYVLCLSFINRLYLILISGSFNLFWNAQVCHIYRYNNKRSKCRCTEYI
ncbi:unnamed protein product [Paramecium octaurelia]|uniref:Uncharacterized protein n=1 Tax=Paramecium octaurelia TaxID=43137 RepID=A0A8S1VKH6_PAROT|nr:unnamed protein product [Paramecium octaurelia]